VDYRVRIHGLYHVVLDVGDLDSAEQFYRELFSLEVAFQEGEYAGDYGKVPTTSTGPPQSRQASSPGYHF
jgi:catechol 2,3-dioxygenase-like lactoylglutathione lyase family enzyme